MDYFTPIVGIIIAGLLIYCCCKKCCGKTAPQAGDDQPLLPSVHLSRNAERFMARENAKADQEEFRENFKTGTAVVGVLSSCTIL